MVVLCGKAPNGASGRMVVGESGVSRLRALTRGFRFRADRTLCFAILCGLFCSGVVCKAQQTGGAVDARSQTAADAAKAASSNKNSEKTKSPQAGTDAASGKSGQQGGDSKSAGGQMGHTISIAPSTPPPGPTGRPRIGLALGGGGALGLSEVGTLEWMEEHHIPIDMIAGTSMGCMVGALYSTGKTVDELKHIMDDSVFSSVFTFNSEYKSRSFRRREDSRELPNGIMIGLKHGVSFRNAVLTDQGLNGFLDRQFFRYDDRTDFNTLPIPLRCISTDLNEARTVTFARGSIPDAVRASVSLPGVFTPFELNGHEFVDGGVLDNLPTTTLRDMKADVILAVSLPLIPVGKGDLNSLLGVLQRSFSVAIEAAERNSRKLADVVVMPRLDGFTQTDYLKTEELAKRGYEAAEAHKSELMRYALNDADWQKYLAERREHRPGPAGRILRVQVKAPNDAVVRAAERKFRPLLDQPLDTKAIEAVLDELRSDGRYDADYSVAYGDNPGRDANGPGGDLPTILVTMFDKKTGPPFLLTGANIEAQTGGVTRATLEGILLWQDVGGYGSEIRGNFKVGFLTQATGEYYRRILNTGTSGGFFVAPHGGILRQPFYITQNQIRIAERDLQRSGGGADIGWSDSQVKEIRAGWEFNDIRWRTAVGNDAQPDVAGGMQRGRVRFVYDTHDRALVPRYGIRSTTEVAYLYNAVDSPNAPQITTQFSYGHAFGKNTLAFAAEGGTMFNRNVAQPFRFTLGGPLRLSASVIDEYRGTDYFLVEPALLRRIAQLPAPLGQSIYLGAGYELGQMRAPFSRDVTRQDVYFGLIAETPLGLITLAPAIGDDGHRKFVFTLGKLF